jgi:hypothetical protein
VRHTHSLSCLHTHLLAVAQTRLTSHTPPLGTNSHTHIYTDITLTSPHFPTYTHTHTYTRGHISFHTHTHTYTQPTASLQGSGRCAILCPVHSTFSHPFRDLTQSRVLTAGVVCVRRGQMQSHKELSRLQSAHEDGACFFQAR